jgi:hypothetical protein
MHLDSGSEVNKMMQVRGVRDDIHAVPRRRAAAAGIGLADFTRQELARLARRPLQGCSTKRRFGLSGRLPVAL